MNLINDFLKTKRETNYHIDMLYRVFYQQSKIISIQAEKIHELEQALKVKNNELEKND